MFLFVAKAFSDGCVGDWGGGDYKDLMTGLDHALAANTWIDPVRRGTKPKQIQKANGPLLAMLC